MAEYYEDGFEENSEEDVFDDSHEEDSFVKCANCGAIITDPENAIKEEKYGEEFYFCSEECKNEFMQ